MKKRPDVLKNFGDRFSRLIKNPTQSRDKKPPKIKQKDLTKFMGCSESNIKEWKDGNWDLSITAIYLIVEYIQDKFTGSTPMHDLFPDLLAKEKIQGSDKLKNEDNDKYTELQQAVQRLKEKSTALERDKNFYYNVYLELNSICYFAPDYIAKYFKGLLPTRIYTALFCVDPSKKQ